MSDLTPIAVRSYPEKLVAWIPLPFYLTHVVLWEVMFLIDYMLGRSTPGGHEHLAEFGALVLFFALVCATTAYCSRVLTELYADVTLFIDHSHTELRTWYEKQLKFSYGGIWPLLFGLGFALLEDFTAGPVIRQFSPAGTALYHLRHAYEFVGFFFLGVGVWALINVIRIPMSLTRYTIKVSLNQISGRGLQALGSAFFRMSLSIILTFIPLLIAVIVSPLSGNTFILVWLGGGVLMIFGFFLLPQIGVHRIMFQEKRQRLMAFTTHLEVAMERSLADPTSENMQRLRELFDLQTHLMEMKEWPFNLNILWQLITALLIPVALAVLEVFF